MKMTQKNYNSELSSVLEFYNRYLGECYEDEELIKNIIKELGDMFIEKADSLNNLDDDLYAKLSYTDDDLVSLGKFGQDIVNFGHGTSFNYLGTNWYIDKYGKIVSVEDIQYKLYQDENATCLTSDELMFLRKSILDMVMQNILVSKIYQAIAQYIFLVRGKRYEQLFLEVNYNIVSYEKYLINREMENEVTKEYKRVRSNR